VKCVRLARLVETSVCFLTRTVLLEEDLLITTGLGSVFSIISTGYAIFNIKSNRI